jgi:hypothetical protein
MLGTVDLQGGKMGKVPETKTEAAKPVAAAPVTKGKHIVKKPFSPNCFYVPDRPPWKPGLLLISTDKVADGCFVLDWQEQSTTWLVSENKEWAHLAERNFIVNMSFTFVFAVFLLIIVWKRT